MTMGQALSERLVALLAGRPSLATVAGAVRHVCEVDHVALVELGSDECTVLAAAGPELLTVGTRSPAVVSTRLVAVSEGRVWSSPDVSRDPDSSGSWSNSPRRTFSRSVSTRIRRAGSMPWTSTRNTQTSPLRTLSTASCSADGLKAAP
ncbi:hypothetical protein [Catenulispora pinisilvae]|uniref:hypothetical protein n=1 Tax=Catenulispora pinisilvae TaxID=2705253 RepID=UPI0018919C59|nr:hypothetical protein [Catenulispora pinisilvae]